MARQDASAGDMISKD